MYSSLSSSDQIFSGQTVWNSLFKDTDLSYLNRIYISITSRHLLLLIKSLVASHKLHATHRINHGVPDVIVINACFIKVISSDYLCAELGEEESCCERYVSGMLLKPFTERKPDVALDSYIFNFLIFMRVTSPSRNYVTPWTTSVRQLILMNLITARTKKSSFDNHRPEFILMCQEIKLDASVHKIHKIN